MNWFTTEEIDNDTYVISEYRHWEETHCYLLIGSKRCLLIDTGLGICNIFDEVSRLTDKHVTAAATHIHWDHIGGHKYFPDFYAHGEELDWLDGKFPLTIETIREMACDRCELPEKDEIDIGGRVITVLHTPGHSPGHMCFWEKERGCLFTGDLVYLGTLLAYYPSTDPEAYLESLKKIAALNAEKIFPAHHSLNIDPAVITEMRDEFQKLKADGKLHHGSGTFDFGNWAVWL